ncbi:OmpA family protein [Nocardiopsis gilva YIM 90087]|uniref:OmpA family protein n=2 Tax=Nocardiopsis gilva TaxID=280236 RepID=A0A223SDY3_9ACTN|nr:OmpA family protein [Nocardiopsis gilva YIM 90087]
MSDDGDREADKTVSGVSLIDPDGQKQYFPWFTENRTCYCSEWDNHNFPPGETWDFWAAYPAPPKGVDKLSISTRIAAPINDIPITDGTAPEEPSGDLTDPKILDIRKLEEDLDSGTSRDESGDDVSVMLSSDVLFDLNESKLTGKADSILKKVAKEIDDSSATTVKIDGYTDSSGNDAINEPLSEDRAKSVEKKIKELTSRSGITYEVAGHGSADPVADNNTEEGAQKNRRVTVTFAK